MANLKRKNDNDDTGNKKIKLEDSLDIYNFDLQSFLTDSNETLDIFSIYKKLLAENEEEYNNMITEKKDKELPDTDPKIVKIKKEINEIRTNIRYNINYLNKNIKLLQNISNKLLKSSVSLCDHDIYSECEYHNDRYYYCRKCSYSR
jgi:hypothetical protein